MSNASFKAVINEIKGRIDIVDLVESFVSLKKSGKNYKGLCPFHDDKNPSMHVNQEKGLFHCFSCGAGGDIFGFLMRYNNISFMEAATELAKKASVEIPKSSGKKGDHRASESGHLFKINKLVSSFYHKNLTTSTQADKAREYLQSRGLNLQIAKEFGLGFAPAKWDSITELAKSRNIKISHLDELGLIIRKDSAGYRDPGYEDYYDRFRNRIIFPILDVNGYVVGFGGRAIDEDDNPKYLNSPESNIFQKRRVFYGLYHSKNEIRRSTKAIVVEGYMDFISLYMAGVKNVVATLGTSLSKQHSMLLRRFAEEVILVYDGDESGINSALRAGELFLEEGLSSSIVTIPENLDPDTYIKKYGKDRFSELLDNARKVADIVIQDTYNSYIDKKISSGKATSTLVEMISKIDDPIEKSEYIKKSVNRFGLRESDFVALINRKRKGFSDENIKISENDKNVLEKYILKLLLNHPELRSEVESEISTYFVDEDLKVIFNRIIDNKDHDISQLISNNNEPHLQELLTNLIFYSDDAGSESRPSEILKECIISLKLKSIRHELKLVREKISDKSGSKSKNCEKKLLRNYRDLVDREKALKRNT